MEKAELEYRLNGLEQAAFQQRAEAWRGAGDVVLFERLWRRTACASWRWR